jgi:hypothetical protein
MCQVLAMLPSHFIVVFGAEVRLAFARAEMHAALHHVIVVI